MGLLSTVYNLEITIVDIRIGKHRMIFQQCDECDLCDEPISTDQRYFN